jgi:hypothetical protein
MRVATKHFPWMFPGKFDSCCLAQVYWLAIFSPEFQSSSKLVIDTQYFSCIILATLKGFFDFADSMSLNRDYGSCTVKVFFFFCTVTPKSLSDTRYVRPGTGNFLYTLTHYVVPEAHNILVILTPTGV